MSRIVQMTIPAGRTDDLLEAVGKLTPVAGIQLQRGVSVKPPGDIVTVEVPNSSLQPLLRLLQERSIGVEPGTSYNVSEPVALVERSITTTLLTESTDAGWEEIHQVLAKESNMTVNSLSLMAIAGVLSTIGISTGTLHLVIAAMVIAPGFEPLTRLALGTVAGGSATWFGLIDTLKGYLALVLGAIVAASLLPLLGKSILGGPGNYLDPNSLVNYWTSSSISSLLISLLAGTAGAIVVATNRTVLTSGVMIALALIPSAGLIGAGIVAGDLPLAGRSAVRWLLDVFIVVGTSQLVFLWKRNTVHKRNAQV